MEFFLGSSYKGIDLDDVLNLVTPFSPYGEMVKKSVLPTTSKKLLEKEYIRVFNLTKIIDKYPEEALNIKEILREFKDVQPIMGKAFKGLVLEDIDFFYLKQWLIGLEKLKVLLKKTTVWSFASFKLKSIEGYRRMLFIDNEGPSFYISEKHSQRLGCLRVEIRKNNKLRDDLTKEIIKGIESQYNVKFNIENSIKLSKFDPETIELLSNCPQVYYYGESYSHMEFKLKKNDKIIAISEKIEELKKDIEDEEYIVRKYLTDCLIDYITAIQENCKIIGRFDWTLTKAFYSREIKGTIPALSDEEYIQIEEGRNPVLERALTKRSKEITPISIEIKKGVTVITGANMGGKSVTLKTVGLIIAMAQMGFLVPCKYMQFSPRDFVFFSQDEGQSIHDGLSTFGMEIKGIKKVLSYRKKKGLYLIDELARGTNPIEGGALALAIANYLHEGENITIMTTHFEELITEKFEQFRITGLDNLSQNMLKKALKGKKGLEVVEDLMDFRLKKVANQGIPREGIKIAELMGVPKEIITTAQKIITSEGRNIDE